MDDEVLDPAAEVRYYGRLIPGRAEPVTVVRVRVTDDGMVEESFTQNLRWEPSDYLRTFHVGRDPGDHVKITAAQAADVVRRIRAELS